MELVQLVVPKKNTPCNLFHYSHFADDHRNPSDYHVHCDHNDRSANAVSSNITFTHNARHPDTSQRVNQNSTKCDTPTQPNVPIDHHQNKQTKQ